MLSMKSVISVMNKEGEAIMSTSTISKMTAKILWFNALLILLTN